MIFTRSMQSKRFFKQLLSASVAPAVLTAALCAAPAAYAQQTTSSMSGQVTTSEGVPANGVKVIITHVPSGTTSTAVTEANGRFNVISLRVGGPYTVRFEPAGAQPEAVTDLFLQLGETFALNLVLKPAAQAFGAEEIVVSGNREALKVGAQRSFNRDQIEDAPSVSRDLKDIIKQDPRVLIDPTNQGAIQIAGTSPRFNSITIDGVATNDDFGLNNNGYPTHHSPIPLDAIDQLAVAIAPFDVDYDGFQGGNINIVTKSGTNEFHGTGYMFYSNDKLSGQDSGQYKNAIPKFQTKFRGGSLGGPIIEDKLFFFAAYEDFQTSAPSTYGTTDGNGGPNKVPGISSADIANVAQIAKSKYGVDIGSPVSATPEHDKTAVAKIDWNISDKHRASFTYTRSETDQILDGGSSANTGTPFLTPTSSLTSTPRLALSSSYYTYGQVMNNYVLQVFDDWTSQFSTQFELGRKTVDSNRVPLNGYGIANVNIVTPGGSEIEFGPDISSQSNVLTTKTDTYKGKFKYSLEDNTISGGYERADNDYYDLFIQRSLGQLYFNSYAAFQAGTASRLQYANSYTGNPNDNAALWSYAENSYYVQDRWTVNDSLTLQGGFRWELYTSGQAPLLSQAFQTRYGFGNNETLNNRYIFLPRFGFNWQVEEQTQIHGGVGQFSTLGPAVWMSNDYNNDGFTQRTFTLTNANALLNYTNSLVVPPAGALGQLTTPNSGFVNALDPNFKIPSSYRFDLAADHDFGEGWKLSADLLYTKVADAIVYQDIRLVQNGAAPDGRPIYGVRAGDTRGATAGQDLLLTNTNKGDAKNAALLLGKTFKDEDFGTFRINSGYSYTDANDVNPGTSSVASSTYGQFAASDPNHPGLATSNYESKHVFTASVTWAKPFFGDALTSLTLLGSARSGLPFSYVFGCGTNPFGDSACNGGSSRELFYVPNGASDPKMNWAASTVTAAQMDAFIDKYGLNKYRGQIAPRNAFNAPWFNTLDLHFLQEIPTPFEGHKLQLTLDTVNFSNLLFPGWGRLEQVAFPGAVPVVVPTIQNGQYVYKPNSGTTLQGANQVFQNRASIWQIQFGLHYSF